MKKAKSQVKDMKAAFARMVTDSEQRLKRNRGRRRHLTRTIQMLRSLAK